MIKRKLGAVLLTSALVISACGTNATEELGSGNTTDQASHNESTEVKITNMDEAIRHLKNVLKENEEVNIEDTEFIGGDGDSYKTDEKGKYFEIILKSKSLQQDGGSGTIGIYKVYEDGEYELAY